MLPDDPNELKAMLVAERVQNERLRQIIKELQRHRFGRRAETLPEDQMLLALEDVEQTEAGAAAETEADNPRRTEQAAREAPRQSRRAAGASAAHRDGRRHRRQSLPVLPRGAAQDRRGRQRAARHRAGAVPRAGRRAGPNTLAAPARTASCRRRRRRG